MLLLLFFTSTPLAKAYVKGHTRKLKSGRIVTIAAHTDKRGKNQQIRVKRTKKQAAGSAFSVHDAHVDDVDFVHGVLAELAEVDELFRFPVSRKTTLPGVMADIAPDFKFVGDDTRPDEDKESGADSRLLFKTDKGKPFYVYRKDKDWWIDVSRLSTGEGGSAIYMALGNYCHNTGQVFVGDPEGLSEDAVIRRTANMLSLALRFGETDFMEPSPRQLRGIPSIGVEPLRWRGDDVAKTKALLYTFLKTLHNQFPEIKNLRYDFNKQQFVDRHNRPVLRGTLERIRASSYGDRSKTARLGEATARRGAFLQSIVASAGSERPGLLELVFRRANQLVEQGDLTGLFAKQVETSTGLSVKDVLAALPKSVYPLLRSGQLRVIPSIQYAPHTDVLAAAKQGLRIQGYYNAKDDKIFLVADALNSKTLPGILNHELYHRAEATDPILKKHLTALDKRLSARMALAAQGQASKLENLAWRRVLRAGTPEALRIKEFKAYLVTAHHADPSVATGPIRQWLKDWFAVIKAALIRQGATPSKITAADLAALARYGARPIVRLAKSFFLTCAKLCV